MLVLKFSKPKVVQHKKTDLNEDILSCRKSNAPSWNTLDEWTAPILLQQKESEPILEPEILGNLNINTGTTLQSKTIVN